MQVNPPPAGRIFLSRGTNIKNRIQAILDAMTKANALAILIPAVALAICLVTAFVTRDAMNNVSFRRGQSAGIVDQRPWQTAQSLAPLAVSAEEQRYAREAERLADHEVDQAFAMALRQASLDQRVLTGDALALSHKISDLQQTVKEDQARVESLTQAAKGPNGADVADDLEFAKAQLTLDTDVLNDASDELARASGDKRGTIQQELAVHEAAMKAYDEQANSPAPTATASLSSRRTLYGRIVAWLNQRSRHALIVQAKQQADADAVLLKAQFEKLQAAANASTSLMEGQSGAQQASDAGAAQPGGDAAAAAPTSRAERLAALKRLASQRTIEGILGDRLQTQRQLSTIYDKWGAQVMLQHRVVLHMMFNSFAWIAFILLGAALTASLLRAVLDSSTMDRRRKQTLKTILMLATQLIALLLIVFVLFGTPNQVPTIIGLATAGLTVALSDFIIAFIGWFVLMGKNGIRVGDWVEINSVSGEVVEIGLFRTVLLETGNWTDKGHPTGRRVSFLNKYAIAGQYFNFSTVGQWMWDEIKVNVPASSDGPHRMALIHQAVLKEAEENANLAASEWQRVARQNGLSKLDTTPAIDMRPAASGTDIVIRYVTRAGDRFDMRNRMYHAVIDLLYGSAMAPDGTAPEAPAAQDASK
jgi:small-conductance mechanosensitive channel